MAFLWFALLPGRDWTWKIYSTVALLFLFYPFPGLNSTDELVTFIRHNMYRTQTPTYTQQRASDVLRIALESSKESDNFDIFSGLGNR